MVVPRLKFGTLFGLFLYAICTLGHPCVSSSTAWAQQAQENLRIAAPPDDMFIDVQVPRHQLYIGETMRIEYDVFVSKRRGNINYSGQDPEFINWYAVRGPVEKDSLVSINGKPYTLMPFDTYFVTPTKLGKLQLPQIKIQVPYLPKGTWITHSPRIVEVLPLPTPTPAGFAFKNVGKFELSATLSKTTVHVGETIVVDIHVKTNATTVGIQLAPYVTTKNPDAVKTYPYIFVKMSEEVVDGKLASEVWFRTRLLALKEGTWELDPFQMITFNPEIHQYQTVSTQPITLTVDGQGVIPNLNPPRIRSNFLEAHRLRQISLQENPKPSRITPAFFAIPPAIMVLFIGVCEGLKRRKRTLKRRAFFDHLQTSLKELEDAQTAKLQCQHLIDILDQFYHLSMLVKDDEKLDLLKQRFNDDDAQFILSALRDLKLMSYSAQHPLDGARTSALVAILNHNAAPEREYA